MLVTFSKERYMERIISGVKKHTIRNDPGKRWRQGMTAHMWMHSPRNVKKNPFQFAEAIISYVAEIDIRKIQHDAGITWRVQINGEDLSPQGIEALAIADGFDNAWEFIDWFGEFHGRLIFWDAATLKRVDK